MDILKSNCLATQNSQLQIFAAESGEGTAQLELPNCFQRVDPDGALIIGLDRSATIGSVATSRSWAEKIEAGIAKDLDSQTHFSGRLGLVMFSSSSSCRPYEGGAIEVSGAFPCLYVEPKSVSDESHRRLLQEFFVQAKGKYSKISSGTDLSGPMEAIATFSTPVEKNARPTVLQLYTDGFFYRSKDAQDVYATMKLESYAQGRAAMTGVLSQERYSTLGVSIHLPAAMAAGLLVSDGDALDTMCAIEAGSPIECGPDAKRSAPETWPVNKMNILDLWKKDLGARNLLESVGISASENGGVEDVWLEDFKTKKITMATVSESGHQLITSIQDGRLLISGIAQKSNIILELAASVDGPQKVLIRQPLTFRTMEDPQKKESALRCTHVDGVTPDSTAPKLGNYQGGGRKCGVVSQPGEQHSDPGILLLLAPIFLPFLALRRRLLARSQSVRKWLAPAFASAMLLSDNASGLDSISGQNLQTFTPVNSGVGLTDEAGEQNGPILSLGIFADQSRDPFVRKSKEGEILPGSVESVSTAHITVSARIMERVQVQLHLPYHHQVGTEKTTEVNDGTVDTGHAPVTDAAGNGAGTLKIDLWRGDTLSLSGKLIGTTPLSKGQSFAADDSPAGGGSLVATVRKVGVSTSVELGRIRRAKGHEWLENETLYQIEGFDFAKIGSTWEATPAFECGIALSGRRYLVGQADEKRFTSMEWTGGVTWHAWPAWDVSVGGGTGVGEGLGSPSARFYTGIVLRMGGGKNLPGDGRVIANSSPGAVGAIASVTTSPQQSKPESIAAPLPTSDNSIKSAVWRGRSELKALSKLRKLKIRKTPPKKKSIKMPQTVRE